MSRALGCLDARRVFQYLLQHRHASKDCGAVFASFMGYDSPLRHGATIGSCRSGGHELWWTVEAGSEGGGLALLPPYGAGRPKATKGRGGGVPRRPASIPATTGGGGHG